MSLFLSLALLPVLARADLTPHALSKQLAAHGASNAARGLSSENWNTFVAGVSSGDKAWLALIPKIASAVDRSHADRLQDALAAALTTNTKEALKTLSVIDAHNYPYKLTYPYLYGTDVVCVPPFDRSVADVKDFYRRTHDALLSTDKGALCLWILEAAMAEPPPSLPPAR